MGKWVIKKLFHLQEMIVKVTDFSCYVDNHWVAYSNLLESYEQVDGSPCGEKI